MEVIDHFLREFLRDRAVPSSEVKEAIRVAGFSERDVRAAKKRLHIGYVKGHGGKHEPTYWFIGPRSLREQRDLVEKASGIPWETGAEWFNQPSRRDRDVATPRQQMLDALYPPNPRT